MHALPFNNYRDKAKDIHQIVHEDLNGPQSTIGNCGEKYYVTFPDEYSKLIKVFPIKSKVQTVEWIESYVNEVENISGKKVEVLRLDNGRAYENSLLHIFANA